MKRFIQGQDRTQSTLLPELLDEYIANEAILDQMQVNLESMPDAMKIRRCTIEHTFGTLKHWMGASHFLMKTKSHVSTEMSLHILAYNMKRVMRIMGSVALMKAMAT